MPNQHHFEKAQRTREQTDPYLESEGYQFSGDSHDHPSHLSPSSRLDILLVQFVEAAKRARMSLIAVSLAAMLLLVGVFNHHYSWLITKEYRHHELDWPKELKDPIDPMSYVDKEDALIDAINRLSQNENPSYPKHQIHELLEVEMKTVEVPVLGIQIYSEDLPILGGIGIMLLLSWFYFVRRRERSIVKMLHSMLLFAQPEKRRSMVAKIFTTVVFSQVFNTIKKLDRFSKSRQWNRFDKTLRIFSYSMPWIPCIIFAIVLSIDFCETFFNKSHEKKIPNATYFSDNFKQYDLINSNLFKNLPDTEQTKFAIREFEKYEAKCKRYTIIKIKRDMSDATTTVSQKKLKIEDHLKTLEMLTKSYRDKLFTDGTTFEYFKYYEHKYAKFQHEHPRFRLSLESEIVYIRTAFPSLILIFNIILAYLSKVAARSRDSHIQGISVEYEKYYPTNFNIYEIQYAYVQFYVVDQNDRPIKGIAITAKHNFRKVKTNRFGLARFIELDKLGKENFRFTQNDRSFWETNIILRRIERHKFTHTKASKFNYNTILDNSRKRKYNKKINMAMDADTGKWIDRFAATRRILKGEKAYKVVINRKNQTVELFGISPLTLQKLRPSTIV